MPLKGNLRDFSATQILNLINLARKTGTLVVYEAVETGDLDAMKQPAYAPGEQRAEVSFKGGKLIYASMGSGQDGNLASILHKAGKLNDKQAQLIRERAANTGDKALALLLIQANYVTQQDIVSSVQQHMLDVVYDLMGWSIEPFAFEDDRMPPEDRIIVPVELENVIIEGSRRKRDLDRLQDELPNLDFALKFPEDPGDKFKGIHLTVEEWRVVSFVNPKNSIRQIARANNMSDLEIRRIVYGLLQAGLVELVKPPGMEERKPDKKQAPQIKKTVVNKLIDRIRTL